jgi:hypothetical protein
MYSKTAVRELALERGEENLGHRIVPTVPRATHAADHPMRHEFGLVGPGGILGGFNWSSQRPFTEVSDDQHSETEIQSFYARSAAITGTPASRAP